MSCMAFFSNLQWVGSLFAVGGTHTHRHIHTAPPAHSWLDVSIVASFLTCMMRWEKRAVTGGAEMCLIALPLVDPLFFAMKLVMPDMHGGEGGKWGGCLPASKQPPPLRGHRRKDRRIEPGGWRRGGERDVLSP